MDGRPNCRNKGAFSNFSSVVWKGPKTQYSRQNGTISVEIP